MDKTNLRSVTWTKVSLKLAKMRATPNTSVFSPNVGIDMTFLSSCGRFRGAIRGEELLLPRSLAGRIRGLGRVAGLRWERLMEIGLVAAAAGVDRR